MADDLGSASSPDTSSSHSVSFLDLPDDFIQHSFMPFVQLETKGLLASVCKRFSPSYLWRSTQSIRISCRTAKSSPNIILNKHAPKVIPHLVSLRSVTIDSSLEAEKSFMDLLRLVQDITDSPSLVHTIDLSGTESNSNRHPSCWALLDPLRFPHLRTLLLGHSFHLKQDMHDFVSKLPRLQTFAFAPGPQLFGESRYWQLPKILESIPDLQRKTWIHHYRRALIGGTWAQFSLEFHFLCLRGSPDQVERAWKESNVPNIDFRLDYWPHTFTALHWAIGGANTAVVRHLVEKLHANVTLKCSLKESRPDMDALELAVALHLPDIFPIIWEHYPEDLKTPDLLYRLFECCNNLAASGRTVNWYRVDAAISATFPVVLPNRDQMFQLLLDTVKSIPGLSLSDIRCKRTGRNLLFTAFSPIAQETFSAAGLSMHEKDIFGLSIDTILLEYYFEIESRSQFWEGCKPLLRLYSDFGFSMPEKDTRAMKAAVKLFGLNRQHGLATTFPSWLSHIVRHASADDLRASNEILDVIFNKTDDLDAIRAALDVQLPIMKNFCWGISFTWNDVCRLSNSFSSSVSGSWKVHVDKLILLFQSKFVRRDAAMEKEMFKADTLAQLISTYLNESKLSTDGDMRPQLLRLIELVVEELYYCNFWRSISLACTQALPLRESELPADFVQVARRIEQIYRSDPIEGDFEMCIDADTIQNLFKQLDP